jgi:hypothetical protein
LISITVIVRDSFKLKKGSEFFVGTDDESLSVVSVAENRNNAFEIARIS